MKKLNFSQMEVLNGGQSLEVADNPDYNVGEDAMSAACNFAGGLIGGIWGGAIALCSFGAAIPVGILVGAAISTTISELIC